MKENVMKPDDSRETEKNRLKPERRDQRKGQRDEEEHHIGKPGMDRPDQFSDFDVIGLPEQDALDSPLCPIYCGLLHVR
jgi:hypothetical protein